MYDNTQPELYRTIGAALLEYEKRGFFLFPSVDARGADRFRIAVSTVTTESLQGYLDDLVAAGSGDRHLFIVRDLLEVSRITGFFTFLGTVMAVGVSFRIVSSGYSMFGYSAYMAAMMVILLSLPLVFVTIQSWSKQARRMRLARLVSYELARRRGEFGDGLMQPTLGEVLLRGLRTTQAVQTPKVYSRIKNVH